MAFLWIYIDILHPTAVGLSNNHAGDFGEGALMHTIRILEQKGYLYAGAGRNLDEAYHPVVFEKDGVFVHVIVVCENEFGIAGEDSAGTAGYQLGRISDAIRCAKCNGNIPIIYFHGGNEFNPLPSPGKVELYRHFIDLGAEAVIAMHTHCPQGYELYNEQPIVYSLGNFFFPKINPKTPTWNYGYMSELEIQKDSVKINVIPYYFDFEVHRILAGKEKEQFINYLNELNNVIKDRKLLKKFFDAWCMISGMECIKNLKYADTMEQGGAEAVIHLKIFYPVRHTMSL